MKAVVCTKYGPPEVLQLQEVEKPVPENNELLIRVNTVFVGVEDIMQRTGKPYFGRIFIGLLKPKKAIPGTEFCGEIEEVGKDVKLFKKGDIVFGVTGSSFGCYAEYICMGEAGLLSLKPPNMTSEEATPVCGALAAWNLLKAIANIQKGKKVLIYGASCSVGTYAVQIARHFGAEVTGVCSTANLEMVKSLGADKVIDYTQEDFTQSSDTYDVIFDAVAKIAPSKRKKSLKKSGIYLSAHDLSGNIKLKVKDLIYLKELCEAGKLRTVIDKRYPMEQIVEAHWYVDKGHKKGNVIITI